MALSADDLADGFMSEGKGAASAAEPKEGEAKPDAALTPAQDAAASAVFSALEKKDKPGFFKALRDCMTVAEDAPDGDDEHNDLASLLG